MTSGKSDVGCCKSAVGCWKSAVDCCGLYPRKLKWCHRSSMNNELITGDGIAKILSWLGVVVQWKVTHWPPLRRQCADWQRQRSGKQLIGHRSTDNELIGGGDEAESSSSVTAAPTKELLCPGASPTTWSRIHGLPCAGISPMSWLAVVEPANFLPWR